MQGLDTILNLLFFVISKFLSFLKNKLTGVTVIKSHAPLNIFIGEKNALLIISNMSSMKWKYINELYIGILFQRAPKSYVFADDLTYYECVVLSSAVYGKWFSSVSVLLRVWRNNL